MEEVLGRQCLLDAVLWKSSSVVSVFLMPCSGRGPRSSVSSGCRALEEVLGRQCLLDAVLWKRSSVVSVFLMPCSGRGPRSSVSS